VCATEIMSIERGKPCYVLRVTALAKMMEARSQPLLNPFDGIFARQLVVLNKQSFVWKPMDGDFKGPKWTKMPKTTAKKFYELKGFASSRRSRVMLGCTKSGAVCVIKFLRGEGLCE
jgi:hypothetical protein